MNIAMSETIDITAQDITGQKHAEAKNVSVHAKIQEVVERLLRDLDLPATNGTGEKHTYRARLKREQRMLAEQEIVADALEPADHLVIAPYIKAGAPVTRVKGYTYCRIGVV